MKANKILVSLLTLVLTVALMFSLFSVSVFAEEADGSTNDSSSSTTIDDHEEEEEEEDSKVETIISISIIGVVLVGVAIYCIVRREKVGKFCRSLNSERKKIVWFSWKDTRKNSIIVIVAIIIIAAVIGVLDLAFNNGIELLYNLFN